MEVIRMSLKERRRLELLSRGRDGVGGSRRARPRAVPVRPRPPPTVFCSRKARLRTRLVQVRVEEIGLP